MEMQATQTLDCYRQSLKATLVEAQKTRRLTEMWTVKARLMGFHMGIRTLLGTGAEDIHAAF